MVVRDFSDKGVRLRSLMLDNSLAPPDRDDVPFGDPLTEEDWVALGEEYWRENHIPDEDLDWLEAPIPTSFGLVACNLLDSCTACPGACGARNARGRYQTPGPHLPRCTAR